MRPNIVGHKSKYSISELYFALVLLTEKEESYRLKFKRNHLKAHALLGACPKTQLADYSLPCLAENEDQVYV